MVEEQPSCVYMLNTKQLPINADMKAIKIIHTVDGPDGTKVLNKIERFKEDGLSLKDFLLNNEIKDLPLFVFSITGKTRSGKSSFLNLMVKYLANEGRPEWKEGYVESVFDFEDGEDSCTKGIWILPHIFQMKDNWETNIGILLLDNQGMCDGEVSTSESIAMCGISTVISHLQMFNLSSKITTNELEQIMSYLVPQKEKSSNLPKTKGSEERKLMFIVRDFIGGRQRGFGLESGQNYIDSEQCRGSEEHQSMWTFVKGLFNRIECLLLPHPGQNIYSFSELKDTNELNAAYISEIDRFFTAIFSRQNMLSSTSSLTGRALYQLINQNDGKLVDESLSYYSMLCEKRNEAIYQEKLELFTICVRYCVDLQTLSKTMENNLSDCGFRGRTACVYLYKLRKSMEDAINAKVTAHILEDYENALKHNIEHSHKCKWPKLQELINILIVGSEEEKEKKICAIMERAGHIFYEALGKEKSNNFTNRCHNCTPEAYFTLQKSMQRELVLSTYCSNEIKQCLDFEQNGGNQEVLNNLYENELSKYKCEIQNVMEKYMFMAKEFLINNYKEELGKENIIQKHTALWVKLIQEMHGLNCESREIKEQIAVDIVKEVASIYYNQLRLEKVKNFISDCEAKKKAGAYNEIYTRLKDEDTLNEYIEGAIPWFDDFPQLICEGVWLNAQEHFKARIQSIVIQMKPEERKCCII